MAIHCAGLASDGGRISVKNEIGRLARRLKETVSQSMYYIKNSLLKFLDEKTVAMRVDCNRGGGPWKSTGLGLLEFGQMAVTRAMCPPEFLHDRVLRDLPHFRSYVLKEGRLFLSLKADAGIYEFVPFREAKSAESK